MTRSGNGTGKLLPFVGMIVAMLTQSGSMVVIKVAIDDINKYVMVVYTFALCTILLLPYALFLQRRSQGPALNFIVLCRFFLLASFGSLGTVVAYVGIDLSSPSLLSAILNLLPAFTFVLALAFRMEEVHWRNSSSQAKVLGTIVSIAGAFVVILYKAKLIMGGIACVADALFTAMWYIYQASVGEIYPDIDVTVIVFFQLLFSTVQCGVFALFSVRDLAEWKLKMDIGLIGILYQAIIATLLRYLLCMWGIIKAGALFCAMFQPVAIIFTVWMGAIFLGDDFTLGSLIGAVVIVIGFYAVQWGKSKEEYEIAKGVQHLDSESLSHGVPLLQDSNT
ncbi:hypothetical protein VNO80_09915 [Phaseolus coccineus]|uniref:WAT1-related protein n=1 Tax=Phaseolus coccineus TaxID=3886 RepID=A0AAN9RA06_PHACN